jgi:NAD(P)-dependent dehydrogenase (short-subunit alcohol dehydrogenase family)
MIDGAGFGKVAIITGCASGLGLATTQLFLSHQYEVLGVDVSEMDYGKIDDKDQERFHFHRGDLTKEGECDEVVRICIGKYGYDILYTRSFFQYLLVSVETFELYIFHLHILIFKSSYLFTPFGAQSHSSTGTILQDH